MLTIREMLEKLEKSKFRFNFKLTKKDKEYVSEKGMAVIRSHTVDFVKNRLSDAMPKNDGKQTPMHGYPSFKAMHGCACCCRGCLNKWYKVPIGRELTISEQEKIVDLLMAWIEKQMN